MSGQIRNINDVMRKCLLAGFLALLVMPLSAQPFIDITGQTIKSRFMTPSGYTRIPVEEISYAAYLRNLPLLPHDAP